MTDAQERTLRAVAEAPTVGRGNWRVTAGLRLPTLLALERVGLVEILEDGNIRLAKPTTKGWALVEAWDRSYRERMKRYEDWR